MNKHKFEGFLLGAFAGVGLIWLTVSLSATGSMATEQAMVPYSEFLSNVEKNAVKSVVFEGSKIKYHTKDDKWFQTIAPPAGTMADQLATKGVTVSAREVDEPFSVASVLLSWLPFVAWIVTIWYFFARPLNAVVARLDRLLAVSRNQSPPA